MRQNPETRCRLTDAWSGLCGEPLISILKVNERGLGRGEGRHALSKPDTAVMCYMFRHFRNGGAFCR
jgi:hypothetical protein